MKKWAINNHPETEKLVLRVFRQNLAMISTAKPQKPIGQLVSANEISLKASDNYFVCMILIH